MPQSRCEYILMGFIDLKSVISIYEFACEIEALRTKEFCADILFDNWAAFENEEFACLKIDDLYDLLQSRSLYPLHRAIEIHRDDVAYVYLLNNRGENSIEKLNQSDENGRIPLELALSTNQYSIAETLIEDGADIDHPIEDFKCLLHYYINNGKYDAAQFLVEHTCNINIPDEKHGTALHFLTRPPNNEQCNELVRKIISLCEDINAIDSNGNTALHLSITNANNLFRLFDFLSLVILECENHSKETPLWLAIQHLEKEENTEKKQFFRETMDALYRTGCSLLEPASSDGSTLLHRCIRFGYQMGAMFLLSYLDKVDHVNNNGETALHLAAEVGEVRLCRLLLEKGANPNLLASEKENVAGETPMHRALRLNRLDVIKELISWAYDSCELTQRSGNTIDFNIEDSVGETPLSLALWKGCFNIASDMIALNADCNRICSKTNMSLAHDAISRQNAPATLFLLEHIGDLSQTCPDGSSLLLHSVRRGLRFVVEVLCQKGVKFSYEVENALWIALENNDEDIASLLVRHGFDTNCWSLGPEQCLQTMLHKAIDINNEAIACFLIKSGCDVNCTRRPGPNGEVPDEVTDRYTPLHMACVWGLVNVVEALIAANADVNCVDSDGNTSLHLGVQNHQNVIVCLLLKVPQLKLDIENSKGLIPFAVALQCRNEKAIPMILKRDPKMAEKFDQHGYNFLHRSIVLSDLESVLFLISSGVNLNSKTRDSRKLAPIHIVAQTGSELIIRNLILTGCDLNSKSANGDTALHVAARYRKPVICSILLDHGIDLSEKNNDGNNALHVALKNSDSDVVSILTSFGANPLDTNAEGHNALKA
ncbi:hypothetical protein ACOME3_007159 [Neoechinorhynchus agilis]